MGLRTQLATGSGRLVRWGLRSVAHRAGSQLPGRLAVSLDPHVIGELSSGILQGSVVVCGTNGKTTTNNVLAAAMEASGRSV
ncbi:MAG: DUF1727 domain-containing protein, partial [Atopobiaceae bacterium]|nr:DUF1727 domain-containing protein [Atopobiaceae bacterium]